jgi:hypothetical protein
MKNSLNHLNFMIKPIISCFLYFIAAFSAHADTGVFVGVTYAFSGNDGLGLTLQATSTRRENRGIFAAGVSYYPAAITNKFGIPVGVGYQATHSASIVSYEFLRDAFAISGGYVNTRDDRPVPITAPTSEPTPTPVPVTPPVVAPPVVAPPVVAPPVVAPPVVAPPVVAPTVVAPLAPEPV